MSISSKPIARDGSLLCWSIFQVVESRKLFPLYRRFVEECFVRRISAEFLIEKKDTLD